MALRVIAALAAVLLLSPLGSAAGEAPPTWVPIQIKRLVIVDDAPAVLLMDEAESRYLLVFVDAFMAGAIQAGIQAPVLERPLTHDLMGIFLRRFHAKLDKVTVTKVKDSIYYAFITLTVNGKVEDIDARPSDAFALAVREKAPIFAAPALLRSVEARQPRGPAPPHGAPEAAAPRTRM